MALWRICTRVNLEAWGEISWAHIWVLEEVVERV